MCVCVCEQLADVIRWKTETFIAAATKKFPKWQETMKLVLKFCRELKLE